MRTLILSVCVLTFVSNCFGQCQRVNDTANFIYRFFKKVRPPFYLYTDISQYTISEIRRHLEKGKFKQKIVDENGIDISDSIILTKAELNRLLNQLNSYSSFRWTEQNMNNIYSEIPRLIQRDTAIEKYEYSHKYQIVPPLFIKNGEYCFFYYDYHCGPLCGHGQMLLYKKENHEWKYWWTYILWDE